MIGSVALHLQEGNGFKGPHGTPASTYVKAKWRGETYKTQARMDTAKPNWNSPFDLEYDLLEDTILRLEIWQRSFLSEDVCLGRLAIDLANLKPFGKSEGWYPLQRGKGEIKISLTLKPDAEWLDQPEEVEPSSSSEEEAEADDDLESFDSDMLEEASGTGDDEKSKTLLSDMEEDTTVFEQEDDDDDEGDFDPPGKPEEDDVQKLARRGEDVEDAPPEPKPQLTAEQKKRRKKIKKLKDRQPQFADATIEQALKENGWSVRHAEEVLIEKLLDSVTAGQLEQAKAAKQKIATKRTDDAEETRHKKWDPNSTEAAAAWLVAEDQDGFLEAERTAKQTIVPLAPSVVVLPPDKKGVDSELNAIQTKRVNSLQSLFPHISRERIVTALRHYHWNKELAIDALVDGRISEIFDESQVAQELRKTALACIQEEEAESEEEASSSSSVNHSTTSSSTGALGHQSSTFNRQSSAFDIYASRVDCSMRQSRITDVDGFAPPTVLADSSDDFVKPTGRTRALLIGINYIGSRRELQGCISDVTRIQKLLTGLYGFADHPHNLAILRDDHPNPRLHPTKDNILAGMDWLVADAKPGDVLFFQFSGHGARQKNLTGTEASGFDETILPMDYKFSGSIVDDEINARLVQPLPSGVKLTAVMDCCHSGTGMDLPFVFQKSKGTWRTEVNPKFTHGDVQMLSACADDETSADVHVKSWGAGGAMSLALIATLTSNPYDLKVTEVLDKIHDAMRVRGFMQQPQLSSSQKFSLDWPFSLTSIHPNTNKAIGRELPRDKSRGALERKLTARFTKQAVKKQKRLKKKKKKARKASESSESE